MCGTRAKSRVTVTVARPQGCDTGIRLTDRYHGYAMGQAFLGWTLRLSGVRMWAGLGAGAGFAGVRVGLAWACYVLRLRWSGVHSAGAYGVPGTSESSQHPCPLAPRPLAASLGNGIRLGQHSSELSLTNTQRGSCATRCIRRLISTRCSR